MEDRVLYDQIIQQFVNLQRLKVAKNKDKELDYQESVLRVKMKNLGIRTNMLEKKLVER